MDLIKKLTGKNPTEYEKVAKDLVNNSNTELFAKLVKQEDFLFDFIKENVAQRIQKACNNDNYKNLLNFLKYYSPSYDTMITWVLFSFSKNSLLTEMKQILLTGTDDEKAYATKYFSFTDKDSILDLIPTIRLNAKSDFSPLAINSIEILSLLNDEISKKEAIQLINSNDEFEQFNAIKFLITYKAKDCIEDIINAMKKSSLAENIASEIPYLIGFDELYNISQENALVTLCNLINAIPEITPATVIYEYGLYDIFEELIQKPLSSTIAVALRLAKDKFEELCSNDEYLYDCDRNTKEYIKSTNNILSRLNVKKLESKFYDELYEESDFVFFAIDFVNDIEELETLLDSKNETLVLKVLTILKEKSLINENHKTIALENITNNNIRSIAESL